MSTLITIPLAKHDNELVFVLPNHDALPAGPVSSRYGQIADGHYAERNSSDFANSLCGEAVPLRLEASSVRIPGRFLQEDRGRALGTGGFEWHGS